jgi:hypothetical protein
MTSYAPDHLRPSRHKANQRLIGIICAHPYFPGATPSQYADSAGRMRLCPTRPLLPRICPGEGVVSGLGPGLTRDSADADVLAFERSAGRPGPILSSCWLS